MLLPRNMSWQCCACCVSEHSFLYKEEEMEIHALVSQQWTRAYQDCQLVHTITEGMTAWPLVMVVDHLNFWGPGCHISTCFTGIACMQAARSGKRKTRCEEGEEERAGNKPAGLSRKAVKRAQGHTPSRKGPALGHKGNSPGPASHGTPLRHVNGPRVAAGTSRLANSTNAADVENAARAANISTAAQVF